MNRSDRILSIFIRLLKGQRLNKAELSTEMNVNGRTVQRDIDDIRSHLYDSEEYGGRRLEVTYSHQDNCYFLDDDKKYPNHFTFKYLLITFRCLSPIINKEMYQFIESEIYQRYREHSIELLDILNTFSISPYSIPTESIDLVLNAIHQSKMVYHNGLNQNIHPYALDYKLGQFTVLSNNENTVEEWYLDKDTFTATDRTFEKTHHLVTLQMSKQLWTTLSESIPVQSVESVSEDTVIALFNLNLRDIVNLCFTHSPAIQLIGPVYIREHITRQLIEMSRVYMNHTVQ